eukprot:gene16910-20109_t
MQIERAKADGKAYYEQQRYYEAMNSYTNAILLSGNNDSCHIEFTNRSLAYSGMRRYKAALSDALDSERLNPHWVKAYICAGAALQSMGLFHEAAETYQRGLDSNPNDPILKDRLQKITKVISDQKGSVITTLEADDLVSTYLANGDCKVFDRVLLDLAANICALINAIYNRVLASKNEADTKKLLNTIIMLYNKCHITIQVQWRWSDTICMVADGIYDQSVNTFDSLSKKGIIRAERVADMLDRGLSIHGDNNIKYIPLYCRFISETVKFMEINMTAIYRTLVSDALKKMLQKNPELPNNIKQVAINTEKALLATSNMPARRISEPQPLFNDILIDMVGMCARLPGIPTEQTFMQHFPSDKPKQDMSELRRVFRITPLECFQSVLSDCVQSHVTITNFIKFLNVFVDFIDIRLIPDIINSVYHEIIPKRIMEVPLAKINGTIYSLVNALLTNKNRKTATSTIIRGFRNHKVHPNIKSRYPDICPPFNVPVSVCSILYDDLATFKLLHDPSLPASSPSLIDLCCMVGAEEIFKYLVANHWTPDSTPLWWCTVNHTHGMARAAIFNNPSLDRKLIGKIPANKPSIQSILKLTHSESFIDELSSIDVARCDPKPNPLYNLYSERRSVLWVGNMTVHSTERNVTIGLFNEVAFATEWTLRKNRFSVFERERIRTLETTATFKCVTSYDSGSYTLVQNEAMNTGYNIQSWTFDLTVLGPDHETLGIVRPPSLNIVSGGAFPTQPIIAHSNTSHGFIEPFIVRSPNNVTGPARNYITYTSIKRDQANRLTRFEGLTVIGETGEYIIGFVDSDTCEIAIMPVPISVTPTWIGLMVMIVFASVLSFIIIILSIIIRIAARKGTNKNWFVSVRSSMLSKLDVLLAKRGEALAVYFRSLKLFIIQSAVFTVLGLILLTPVTIQGDNKLFDIYKYSQPNWMNDSSFLYFYQVVVFLIFVSMIIIYTRFNKERIFLAHDSNHLVSSRSVLLTGLPKSLVDCTVLKDYLQTGYSTGVYALSIILEKDFSYHDKMRDLEGDGDVVDPKVGSLETQSPLKSTGNAFITFSCVSDAHLFKTQFSPHRWSWAKAFSPVPPPIYAAELQIKQWRAYNAPPVSDILWTRLHNPSNQYSSPTTIFLIAISLLFFCLLSSIAIFIYDSQFGRIISIVVVPSTYFILMMGYDLDPYQNLFFLPMDFHRTGVIFYCHFIIYYAILTPFLDSTCVFITISNLFKYLFMNKDKKVRHDSIFSENSLNLTTQYTNYLLMVFMVSIYAPLFPLLFLPLFVYLFKKYYFDKYLVVASTKNPSVSDRLLVAPMQHCVWLIMTLTSGFYLLYVLNFDRTDLIACDGAIMPCLDTMDFGKKAEEQEMTLKDGEDYDDQEGEEEEQQQGAEQDLELGGGSVLHARHPHTDINGGGDEELKESTDKEMILNIQQNYSSTQSKGFFSFMFNSRYMLPKPKAITIIQYSSPFFNTELSQCALMEGEEEYN